MSFIHQEPVTTSVEGMYPSNEEQMRVPVNEEYFDNEYGDAPCKMNHYRHPYRRCHCCECEYERMNKDEERCPGGEQNGNLELAYQHGGKYPELVEELEVSISQRNKERFQKSMKRFELLSRQEPTYNR